MSAPRSQVASPASMYSLDLPQQQHISSRQMSMSSGSYDGPSDSMQASMHAKFDDQGSFLNEFPSPPLGPQQTASPSGLGMQYDMAQRRQQAAQAQSAAFSFGFQLQSQQMQRPQMLQAQLNQLQQQQLAALHQQAQQQQVAQAIQRVQQKSQQQQQTHHHHHHHRLPAASPPRFSSTKDFLAPNPNPDPLSSLPPSGQESTHTRLVGQPGMPLPAPKPKGPKIKFTPEDDALLVELKETKNLTWKQIADFFLGGRSSGTLQVRYCTKLKAKGVEWSGEMVDRLKSALRDYEADRWRVISNRVGSGVSAAACKEKVAELEELERLEAAEAAEAREGPEGESEDDAGMEGMDMVDESGFGVGVDR